jgi:hypothetical protein
MITVPGTSRKHHQPHQAVGTSSCSLANASTLIPVVTVICLLNGISELAELAPLQGAEQIAGNAASFYVPLQFF